ncbi:hypothetical protein [Qipengyuania oceanensis]|uniref:Uncharacterized protein n=1 Tax=Qipengyuania oceanensis TaxID=1463597 RepID=A0A844YFY4_9SPHN|nr:hypothetical protein [Qipengyuania oceanensis]MXO62259.1 hypothetical protein [Qipengyuania oceanensis]
MNIDPKKVAFVLGASAMLGACATDPKTGDFVQYEFGDAVKQTMMAQVVDPDPEYETLVPESSGEHSSAAIKRYREGNVKEPRRQGVTSGSGGGGS